jgi:hypothetical protein
MPVFSTARENLMSDTPGIERRTAIRFPFKYPIRHHLVHGEKTLNHSLCDNLSLSGILFHSPTPYQKDQVVEILVDIPPENRSISLLTLVVWTRPDPLFEKQFFIGGLFKDLSSEFLFPLMDMAIKDLSLSIERDPNNLWLYRYRGDIKKARGDTKGADTDYEKADQLKNRFAK